MAPAKQRAGTKKAKQQRAQQQQPPPETTMEEAEADAAAAPGPQPHGRGLTLQQIAADSLTVLAQQHWDPAAVSTPRYDAALVRQIYEEELLPEAMRGVASADDPSAAGNGGAEPPQRRAQVLEISQYLERYLLPAFAGAAAEGSAGGDDDDAAAAKAKSKTTTKKKKTTTTTTAAAAAGAAAIGREHVLSMVMLLNEKFREGVSGWASLFDGDGDAAAAVFPAFFARVLALLQPPPEGAQAAEAAPSRTRREYAERVQVVLLLIQVFQSLGEDAVRAQALRLVSLHVWHLVTPARVAAALAAHPAQLAKPWRYLQKREAKAAARAASADASAA
eukprot:scaffold63_cov366-Prasinococcus_capsulatus_cf.AAC.1